MQKDWTLKELRKLAKQVYGPTISISVRLKKDVNLWDVWVMDKVEKPAFGPGKKVHYSAFFSRSRQEALNDATRDINGELQWKLRKGSDEQDIPRAS